MASTIQLKRSSTASSTPSAGSLTSGELAINTADGTLFMKNSSNVVVKIAEPTTGLVHTSGAETIAGIKTFSSPIVGDGSSLTNLTVATDAQAAFPGYTIDCWGDSLTSNSYPTQLATLVTRTVYNGGAGGETSTQIKVRMLAATDKLNDSVVIWAGHNNFSSPTTVKADIAAMIAALGHTRYLVLALLNDSTYTSGTANYTTITTLNSDLATLYGVRYFDIRAYLISQYNSGLTQDVTDHTNDVIPSSLRINTLHLTDAGYLLVAQQVVAKIAYLNGTTVPLQPSNMASIFRTLEGKASLAAANTFASSQFITAANGYLNVLSSGSPYVIVTATGVKTKMQSFESSGYGAIGTESNHPLHFWINNATAGYIDTDKSLQLEGSRLGFINYNWGMGTANDTNWGYTMYNSGSTYYMRIHYVGNGSGDFRAGFYDSSNTAWSAYADTNHNWIIVNDMSVHGVAYTWPSSQGGSNTYLKNNGSGTLSWASGTGADSLGTYIVQTSTNAPANAQVLASLSTGLLKVTTTTGVLSVAAAGTDYLTPSGNGSALTGMTGGQISGNIAGNAANVTGTVGVTNGGTGLTTATLGDLRYGSASNVVAILAGNTTSTKKFLTQTGTGTVSAVPAWGVLVAGDIPDLSATYITTSSTSTLTNKTLTTPLITAVSAPSAVQGQVYFDLIQLALCTGMGASANPAQARLVGCLYSQYSSSTGVVASATNSTLFAGSPSAIGSLVLPIGFFVAGKTIRLQLWGMYTSSNTGGNNLITVKLNLINSTPTTVQLGVSPASQLGVSQTNATFSMEAMITCRTTGSSGTVFAQGMSRFGNSAAITSAFNSHINATAVATIDTTKTQQIDITVTTGSGMSAVTVTNCVVEALN